MYIYNILIHFGPTLSYVAPLCSSYNVAATPACTEWSAWTSAAHGTQNWVRYFPLTAAPSPQPITFHSAHLSSPALHCVLHCAVAWHAAPPRLFIIKIND